VLCAETHGRGIAHPFGHRTAGDDADLEALVRRHGELNRLVEHGPIIGLERGADLAPAQMDQKPVDAGRLQRLGCDIDLVLCGRIDDGIDAARLRRGGSRCRRIRKGGSRQPETYLPKPHG